jgi:hypothetical protein
METLPIERLQDVDRVAAGKAFEQYGLRSQAHGEAWRSIIMGRASTFTVGACPPATQTFDDLLCAGCCI